MRVSSEMSTKSKGEGDGNVEKSQKLKECYDDKGMSLLFVGDILSSLCLLIWRSASEGSLHLSTANFSLSSRCALMVCG